MKFIYLIILALFFAGCGGDSEAEDVIIGVYFGFCSGDCAMMYLQSGDDIFPDVISNGYTEAPAFSSDPISVTSDILERFQALYSDTPQLLLDNVGDSFGSPDAGDWGAIHYQIGEDSWTLDNANSNNPTEIQDFVQEIQSLIQAMN